MKIGMRIPGKMRNLSYDELAAWAKSVGLDAIDLPGPSAEAKAALDRAGLAVGTVDASSVGASLSKDEAARAKAVAQIKAEIDTMASLGMSTLFVCLIPADTTMPRADSFAIFKETYPEIVAHAASKGVSLAMEPYPGPAPHFPTLGCTPEMYRAIFAVIDSPALGICYDPSHYVRMGIDYLRVLAEFGSRVRHVHGKDTEILEEGRYLYGFYGPTFPTEIGWSRGDWRYCIPGTGEVNWARVVAQLAIAGYDGIISIELEDHVYGGSLEANQRGIVNSARHLRSVM